MHGQFRIGEKEKEERRKRGSVQQGEKEEKVEKEKWKI